MVREGLVRFDHLPLVAPLAGLPALPRGARVELRVRAVDEWALTVDAGFAGVLEAPAVAVDQEALPEDADLAENSD